MKMFITALLMICCFLSLNVSAASPDPNVSFLRKAITNMVPSSITIRSITKTPVKNLYQVVLGGRVVYITANGKYILEGNLVQVSSKENLTQLAQDKVRKNIIDNYPDKKLVVYTPPGKVKHTITVITDLDCAYCSRMHSEMSKYMADGIKVRYMFMPAHGPTDYNSTVSVWCSKNRRKALDTLRNGGSIAHASCNNPIMEQFKLARSLGIVGTPSIILSNGDLLPGYVPEQELAVRLNTSS